MSNGDIGNGKRLAEHFATFTEEQRDKFSRDQIAESDRQHERFVTAFKVGSCYLCGTGLATFEINRPCIHWLLRPSGFKKKHFAEVAKHFGVMQIQSWLRWVANTEGLARNIVDTAGENGNDKILEVTVRYRDLKWSISCAESDFRGHKNSNHGANPHYHFQMLISDRPFINYRDFHSPLHRHDVVGLEMLRNSKGVVKGVFRHGEGIRDLLTDENAEAIVGLPMEGEPDPERAAFSIHTFMVAEPGTTISGDAIQDMIEAARSKGVSIASIARDFPGADTRIFIEEGPGVVEPAPRAPLGGSKEKEP